MSRPIKYNEKIQQDICKVLRAGNTRACAARYVGIDPDTFRRWMQRYTGFYGAVTRAEAEVEIAHVGAIQRAAQEGDWRAALEWLKRRRAEDWGDKLTHDLDAEIAGLMAELVAEGKGEAQGTP